MKMKISISSLLVSSAFASLVLVDRIAVAEDSGAKKGKPEAGASSSSDKGKPVLDPDKVTADADKLSRINAAINDEVEQKLSYISIDDALEINTGNNNLYSCLDSLLSLNHYTNSNYFDQHFDHNSENPLKLNKACSNFTTADLDSEYQEWLSSHKCERCDADSEVLKAEWKKHLPQCVKYENAKQNKLPIKLTEVELVRCYTECEIAIREKNTQMFGSHCPLCKAIKKKKTEELALFKTLTTDPFCQHVKSKILENQVRAGNRRVRHASVPGGLLIASGLLTLGAGATLAAVSRYGSTCYSPENLPLLSDGKMLDCVYPYNYGGAIALGVAGFSLTGGGIGLLFKKRLPVQEANRQEAAFINKLNCPLLLKPQLPEEPSPAAEGKTP